MSGLGIGVGFEQELENQFAIGLALHRGTLTERESYVPSSEDEFAGTTGEFSIWTLWLVHSVPEDRPWFYYGGGLMWADAKFELSGERLDARYFGISAHIRAAYTFQNGWFVGATYEAGALPLSFTGSYAERIKNQGTSKIVPTPRLFYVSLGKNF